MNRVDGFSQYFGRPPEALGTDEIRKYLHHLIVERDLSQDYIKQVYSALKFFYTTTLDRGWDLRQIPRARKVQSLPQVLSISQVQKILDTASSLKYQAIFTTVYSAGLLTDEVAHLRVGDIDSERMMIRVNQGKGKKDRYTLLGKRTLLLLRDYWRVYQPKEWLFYGQDKRRPISSRSIQNAFAQARDEANIPIPATVRTLRHCFATHLLDAGVELYFISQLLGHASPNALNNQVGIYNLLFKAASDTLKELGEDSKRLKAKLGILAVLHTWSQTLAYHPHLHCIVTGGGLSLKDEKWVASKPDFLFPVRVMSKLFRGKFLDALKQTDNEGQLKHADAITHANFKTLLDTLYRTNWVVYCKPPFGGPKHVIAYLSRYTHRVAISNQRILKIEKDEVIFSYRDRKNGDQLKTMTLPALTFIQRFLMHVLPKHFVKIRYFGILCNRYRKDNLTHCRKLLCILPVPPAQQNEDTSYLSLVKILTGCDPTVCPQCKKGHLHFAGILAKSPERAPPAQMA